MPSKNKLIKRNARQRDTIIALRDELDGVETRCTQLQYRYEATERERQYHQDRHAQLLSTFTKDGILTPEAKADTEAAYQRGLDAGRAQAGPTAAHELDVKVGRALLPSLMALQALEQEIAAVNRRINDAYHEVSSLVNPQEQSEPFTVVTEQEAADLAAGAEAFANAEGCDVCGGQPCDDPGLCSSTPVVEGGVAADGPLLDPVEQMHEDIARINGEQLASEHCGGTLGHSRHERSNGVICPGTTVRRV